MEIFAVNGPLMMELKVVHKVLPKMAYAYVVVEAAQVQKVVKAVTKNLLFHQFKYHLKQRKARKTTMIGVSNHFLRLVVGSQW